MGAPPRVFPGNAASRRVSRLFVVVSALFLGQVTDALWLPLVSAATLGKVVVSVVKA